MYIEYKMIKGYLCVRYGPDEEYQRCDLRHVGSYVDYQEKEINKLKDRAAELEEVQQWVSVKEYLPEIGHEAEIGIIHCILAVTENEQIIWAHRGWYGYEVNDVGDTKDIRMWHWTDANYNIINNITHWMPLPRLPKADSNETNKDQ